MKWKSIKGCSLLDIFGLTISVLWKWNNIIWFSHRTDYLHLFCRVGNIAALLVPFLGKALPCSHRTVCSTRTAHIGLGTFDGQMYSVHLFENGFSPNFLQQINMHLNRNLFVSNCLLYLAWFQQMPPLLVNVTSICNYDRICASYMHVER